VLGCLFLAAPAFAQAVSTSTVQVAGTVGGAKTAAASTGSTGEAVVFSGPVQVTCRVMTNPAGPPTTTVVSIDARQVQGTGASTGTVYANSGQANLTRPFAATDQIQTTFAFFPSGAGGYLKARTALLTLNLTYDTTTLALTGVSGTIASF
jgi:hypothetical protein